MKDLKQDHLHWTAISNVLYTYAEAAAYAASLGGRLPTKDELVALYNSGALKGLGWTLFNTWSSTPNSAGGHYIVYLNDGDVYWDNDTDSHYVSCVRELI